MAVGRGKVILLGEHAAVYGVPVLAVGLERGASAVAQEGGGDRLHVLPWDVAVTGREPEPLARAFHALLGTYGARPSIHIEAEAHIPAGAGLGCSAALGVAVVGAVDELLDISRSSAGRAEASMAWEEVFHGNPSGVDSAMAAHGGVGLFEKGKTIEPVEAAAPLHLVIGHCGQSSSTRAMVQAVADRRARNRAGVDGAFASIGHLVQAGRRAVEAGDCSALGEAMNENHALLQSLEVSNAALDRMCVTAREAGAYGSKLTGAGGGGCMIALVGDRTRSAVQAALGADGEHVFAVEVGR